MWVITFPMKKRGWANGWVMSGIALGQIIGIPLGTFLAEELGFKFPFVIFGVVMFLNFFLILILFLSQMSNFKKLKLHLLVRSVSIKIY